MLQEKWPQSAQILDMGFSDKGNVDLESVISRQPDLMIAQLRAKPALEESGVISKLSALNIPVLFVDYEINPGKDTAPSIDLLGKSLTVKKTPKPIPTITVSNWTPSARKPRTSPRRLTFLSRRWRVIAMPAASRTATTAGAVWSKPSARTISVRICCRALPDLCRWKK